MKSETAKQVMVTLLAAFIIVVAAIGVSYAAFSYINEGSTVNVIKPGEIYLKLNESKKGISMLSAVPLSDYEGTNLFGDGNVYSFNVTSTLKSGSNIVYDIVLKNNIENISADMIKVYLVSVDGENTPLESEKLIVAPTYLSSLKKSDLAGGDNLSLYKGSLVEGDNIVNNYRLKVWISDHDINGNFVSVEEIDENAIIEVKLGLYAKAN